MTGRGGISGPIEQNRILKLLLTDRSHQSHAVKSILQFTPAGFKLVLSKAQAARLLILKKEVGIVLFSN